MASFVFGVLLQLFGGSFFGLGLFDAMRARESASRTLEGVQVFGKKYVHGLRYNPDYGARDALTWVGMALVIMLFVLLIAVPLSLLPWITLAGALLIVTTLVAVAFYTFMGGLPRVRSVSDFFAFLVLPPLNVFAGLWVASILCIFTSMPASQTLLVSLLFVLASLVGYYVALTAAWTLSRFARVSLLVIGTLTYGFGVWVMT